MVYAILTDKLFRDYSDKQLLALSKQPSPHCNSAFEELVHRYQPFVFRLCLRYLHHEQDAHDASQEVFIRVCKHLRKFQGRSSFRTWLYRITQNQCHSLQVSRQRWLTVEESAELAEQQQLELDTGPESELHSNTCITQALQRLSPSDRKVLELRFYQDLSLEQIAAHLNTRLSAAKMRLYRACDRFKQIYKQTTTATV